MEEEKEENKKPHFVATTYPADEPWRTDIYFGQRNGSGFHAHLVASGAEVIYFRDIGGTEIINEFKEND